MLWNTGENKMIKGFIVAVQFLSRIPLNIKVDFNDKNIRNSMLYYPLIGILIGILSYIPYYLLSPYSLGIASFFVVFSIVIWTGGLHLDGLSDTVDGFFSNRERERVLEIMKDSRIGAFGVLSLIFIILLKYVLLLNFNSNLFYPLILSMANGRFVALIQIVFKKIARPNGMGDMLKKTKPIKNVFISAILYVAYIIYVDPLYLLPLGGAIILAELISIYTYKKIGGFTGDVYGTTIELGEVFSLFIFWGILNIWI